MIWKSTSKYHHSHRELERHERLFISIECPCFSSNFIFHCEISHIYPRIYPRIYPKIYPKPQASLSCKDLDIKEELQKIDIIVESKIDRRASLPA